jgi:hypothetical protein
LRGNFVAAAHLGVRFTPRFLRALHLEPFTEPPFRWIIANISVLSDSIFCHDKNFLGFCKDISALFALYLLF